MTLDWYPFFVVDYRRDTRHLTLEEDGAYRRLIDEYMLTREALPNDDAALARILGISTAEWDRLKGRVRPFFKARNDRLLHKRCEEELRAQDNKSRGYSDRGKRAAFTRWSKIRSLDARPLRKPATLQDTYKTTSSEDASAREGQPTKSGDASPVLSEAMRRKGWI